MPGLPVLEFAELSSDSTAAFSSGSNFDSSARLVMNRFADASPQSVISVDRLEASPVSSDASSSSAAGSRRVRMTAMTAGVTYYKTASEENMHAKFVTFLSDSAFELYRKCQAKERRMVNKGFLMAKSRFMNRFSKVLVVVLSRNTVIRLNPSQPTKLQMRGVMQKWVNDGSHDTDVKPLDRGSSNKNLLHSMLIMMVSPTACYSSLHGLSVFLIRHGEWGTCAVQS